MKNLLDYLMLMLFCFVSISFTFAQTVIPSFNVQGKIINNAVNPPVPLTGTQTLVFKIDNGINPTWVESQSVTLDADGVYSVDLNTNNTLSENLLLNGATRQIKIHHNGANGPLIATIDIQSVLSSLIAKRALYADNGTPTGGIIMYSGTMAATHFDATGLGVGIMKGWALCNGNNNTPNMINRFVVGGGGSYAYNNIGGVSSQNYIGNFSGNTGGISNNPNICNTTYNVWDDGGALTPYNSCLGNGSVTGIPTLYHGTYTQGTHHLRTEATNNGDQEGNHAHSYAGTVSVTVNHLPPYLALAYIQRIQ